MELYIGNTDIQITYCIKNLKL